MDFCCWTITRLIYCNYLSKHFYGKLITVIILLQTICERTIMGRFRLFRWNQVLHVYKTDLLRLSLICLILCFFLVISHLLSGCEMTFTKKRFWNSLWSKLHYSFQAFSSVFIQNPYIAWNHETMVWSLMDRWKPLLQVSLHPHQPAHL